MSRKTAKVSEDLHSRVKAVASLKKISIMQAWDEAARLWIEKNSDVKIAS